MASNLLLEACQPGMTDMRAIFRALPGICAHHDWLLSDLEFVCVGDSDAPEPGLIDGTVIEGERLQRILDSGDIQFCWGVFSALPKGLDSQQLRSNQLPFADCNPDLWIGSPKPQLDEAIFEIVCWDSQCTLLIGLDEAHAASFRESFPGAADLDVHNQRNAV